MNRSSCCQERLVGARVIVSETADYTSNDATSCGSTVTMAEVVTAVATDTNRIVKPCAPGTSGRYVTIQIDGVGVVTLCEVKVYSDCTADEQACNACGDSLHNQNSVRPTMVGRGFSPLSQNELKCVCFAFTLSLSRLRLPSQTLMPTLSRRRR